MTMSETWRDVDDYFGRMLVGEDPVLEEARRASAEAGLPDISVAPNQGKLLQLLARIRGARAILEIGTLGGYSTIWLARALPADGRMVSLEANPAHAEVARANLARAGLAGVAEVVVGPALETLPSIEGPFDLVFIDADKPNNANYFRWAMRLTRPGGVVVVDNVVRGGAVARPGGDAAAEGVRRLNEALAAEPRVSATAVQTVGAKGHDGFVLVYVES